MGPLEIALIAAALVLDAIAVAAALGVAAPRVRVVDALRMGLLFGAFHVIMPAVGWALGAGVGKIVQAWDHWIACVLLLGVGGAMLRGALRAPDADDEPKTAVDPLSLKGLFPLAIATSIDALAVGVSLPLAHAPMALSLTMFGGAAFVASGGTLLAARRAGHALGARAQRALAGAGGLALLALAAKIPFEHLRDGI